jgi:hypothetical protein
VIFCGRCVSAKYAVRVTRPLASVVVSVSPVPKRQHPAQARRHTIRFEPEH